jgi:hypothetical protein
MKEVKKIFKVFYDVFFNIHFFFVNLDLDPDLFSKLGSGSSNSVNTDPEPKSWISLYRLRRRMDSEK